jgi:hypothetical protein
MALPLMKFESISFILTIVEVMSSELLGYVSLNMPLTFSVKVITARVVSLSRIFLLTTPAPRISPPVTTPITPSTVAISSML